MFKRDLLGELEKWSEKSDRKPLIIRGARQVGKTTLVNQFAGQFSQYIYLNLELPNDRKPFEQFNSVEELLQALFFLHNKSLAEKHQTLIFIDEIQEVPVALAILRHLYEKEPNIHVVAAGSMLESLFNKDVHFPVGRVEYKVLRPVSFPEFLLAIGERSAYEALQQIPLPEYAHPTLMRLYHTYTIVGGMPAVVQEYAKTKDFAALEDIFDSLIASYLEDVEKYAGSQTQVLHTRHAIRSIFGEAGKRIKFAGFGKSDFGSKVMGDALRMIEKAMLIHLIYPLTSPVLPMIPDIRKSPRLQILDTGLLNYFLGIQRDVLTTEDLHSVYKGTMVEHLTGQEIIASQHQALSTLYFWVREKNSSMAEIDFIYPFESLLVPIEVKSGKSGKLKSLHLFMDLAPHDIAIRFYADHVTKTSITTINDKTYKLLHLPYFLGSQIEKYIAWLIKTESNG